MTNLIVLHSLLIQWNIVVESNDVQTSFIMTNFIVLHSLLIQEKIIVGILK